MAPSIGEEKDELCVIDVRPGAYRGSIAAARGARSVAKTTSPLIVVAVQYGEETPLSDCKYSNQRPKYSYKDLETSFRMLIDHLSFLIPHFPFSSFM